MPFPPEFMERARRTKKMGARFRTPITIDAEISASHRPKTCLLRVLCYPLIQSPATIPTADSTLNNQLTSASTLRPRDAGVCLQTRLGYAPRFHPAFGSGAMPMTTLSAVESWTAIP